MSRRRPRRRTVIIWAVALLAVVAAVAVPVALSRPAGVRTVAEFVPGTPESGVPVELDTTLYLPAHTPAPAVLLAHGFGGSKASEDGAARTLARAGYVVLAYTARGFGRSGGDVHLDAPGYEVADARLLITHLATLPQVQLDSPGDPHVGVAGGSYGGGLALLLAGTDRRVDAVAADITWNDLNAALFPGGVFKKLWAGYLFEAGSGPTAATGCGRFAPTVCAAYQQAAATGRDDGAIRALLHASSPSTVLGAITAPTLLSQGEQDSLFPLQQADANARGIAAHGTTVDVVWRAGGHDAAGSDVDVTGLWRSWFDTHLRGRADHQPAFTLTEQGSALSAATGRTIDQTLDAARYPGLTGTAHTTVTLAGPTQPVAAPAGGNPAAVTSLPQLGGLLTQVAALGGGSATAGLAVVPGQTAVFDSAPLGSAVVVAGAPTATLTVTSSTHDATLFVGLRDVAPDGSSTLPQSLVNPITVPLRPGRPTRVSVQLPGAVYRVAAGHHVRLTVSTTDLAYFLPSDPRTYTIGLAATSLDLPTVAGSVVRSSGAPLVWLLVGVAALLLALLAGSLAAARRRQRDVADPALLEVPVSIEGLSKVYADGLRAVDDVSFRVERGQVVGLLGPNGAGKTTALRMLVGLIRPTSGVIHVFGRPVRPGVAVLARIGAFIEGPGFLPHLSGRDNLRLYWGATGRPDADAQLATALDIAGLGSSVDRRVKTYSQGMRQRLGIAQAMLGLPELLVLDEPTNGLDPPQIAEMREVLRRYAETGRTVVVSSHLLAEVEQTCTHVVVMHHGRLIATGSVTEVAGTGGSQLAVADPERAASVLASAGMTATLVPARRALEEVFLDMIGDEEPR